MCVNFFIQNNYTLCTIIYYVNTNFYFGCDKWRLIVTQP